MRLIKSIVPVYSVRLYFRLKIPILFLFAKHDNQNRPQRGVVACRMFHFLYFHSVAPIRTESAPAARNVISDVYKLASNGISCHTNKRVYSFSISPKGVKTWPMLVRKFIHRRQRETPACLSLLFATPFHIVRPQLADTCISDVSDVVHVILARVSPSFRSFCTADSSTQRAYLKCRRHDRFEREISITFGQKKKCRSIDGRCAVGIHDRWVPFIFIAHDFFFLKPIVDKIQTAEKK